MAREDYSNQDLERFEDDSGLMTSHKYETVFSILDMFGLEEHVEQLEYKTWCSYSSSWEIKLEFEKDVPFNNFNLLVTLRRIDWMRYILKGILVIWFLNINGKRCSVPYHLKFVKDGHGCAYDAFAVDPHFNCLLRESDHLTLPDDVLVVRVQLFVKGCCNDKIKDEPEIGENSKEEGASKVLCCPKL